MPRRRRGVAATSPRRRRVVAASSPRQAQVALLVAGAAGGPAAERLGGAVAVFSFSAVVTSFVGFYFGLRAYVRDVLVAAESPAADDERVSPPARSTDASGPPRGSPTPRRRRNQRHPAGPRGRGPGSADDPGRGGPHAFFASAGRGRDARGRAERRRRARDAPVRRYGITFLFGVVPAACCWRLRRDAGAEEANEAYVPGGDAVLAAMVALSGGVIVEGALDAAGMV